ncbi:MAG: MotA/TolQ/ExbB proton channel family protein [Planctomycetes bacterium]|nr:MotA/TolQ/ExbB proton channel family protein [Planctomycetota bacterium]NUQ33832.1 MotA/TolQ/ExbB proton channel family protein [Planctomycetaceae bacterium]
MTIRTLLLAAQILFAATLAADDAILESARAKRAGAERDLATFRSQRIEEEKQLNQQINALYGKLAVARNEHAATDEKLRTLQADVDRARRERSTVIQKATALERALSACAGIALAVTDDAAAFKSDILSGVDARLDHVKRSCSSRMTAEHVFGRTGASINVPVLHIGEAYHLACGATDDTRGLLVSLGDGKWQVSGEFPREAHGMLAAAMASDKIDALPFDISGSLARRPAAKEQSFWEWIETGGFFCWPILALGVLGLLLCIERATTLVTRWPAIRTYAEQALAGCSTIAGAEARESKIESVLLAVEPRLERSMTLIAAVAAIAPLLGLLGTVTGMITTFDVISVEGTGDARNLSGGISVALITTQLGLMVAIPMVLLHAAFRRLVERREATLEAMAEAARGPSAQSPQEASAHA